MAQYEYCLVHVPLVREDSVVLLCSNNTELWSIRYCDSGRFKKYPIQRLPKGTNPESLKTADQDRRIVDPLKATDKANDPIWCQRISDENRRRGIGQPKEITESGNKIVISEPQTSEQSSEFVANIEAISKNEKIFIQSTSPDDWRKLLAKPDLHWKTGKSAKSLAYGWSDANGFPDEVHNAFQNCGMSELENLEMLIAIPEFEVNLPGGERASQNDVFVLAKGEGPLVVIMVEGKVSESFGPELSKWLVNASAGKIERLRFLKETLGISEDMPGTIRYQLIHRTASAVITARKFGAGCAVMLVHSYSPEAERFDDFKLFAEFLGAQIDEINTIKAARTIHGIPLYLGWVEGDEKYLRF